MPFPCHAVLLRVSIVSFPFDLHSATVFDSHTQCRSHAFPLPCHEYAVLKATSRPRHGMCNLASAVQRRHVGDLPAFGTVGEWQGRDRGTTWYVGIRLYSTVTCDKRCLTFKCVQAIEAMYCHSRYRFQICLSQLSSRTFAEINALLRGNEHTILPKRRADHERSSLQPIWKGIGYSLPISSFIYLTYVVLGVFAKLRKTTISFVTSVCPSTRNTSVPTGRIFMKFDMMVIRKSVLKILAH
jgi:hypothetical protein